MYVYDFEMNRKWYMAPRVKDHFWNDQEIYYVEDKGAVVSADPDSVVRGWVL